MANASCASNKKYKLSCKLIGHEDEIRNLAVFNNGNVVSTSKDKTARLWILKDGKYLENIIMQGHNDAVCSVCVIEPTEKNPTGFIITGSNKNIYIYYPKQTQPIQILQAHENMVNSLRASSLEKESFLSCSLDFTGKLWNLYNLNNPQTVYLNNSAVWCIVDLLNGCVITGGSDKKVIVYSRDGKILHKLNGHLDCIKDIAPINENQFLTCGNDSVTKHWNALDGTCLGTYSDHAGHIYSISAILGGSIAVSCGQDKTVKIWHNGQVDQTITIPAQTVWSVKFLPNQDIVCGSSDGIVTIFTTDEKRYTDKESLLKFERNVSRSIENSIIQDKHNNVDNNFFPLARELNQPGEKDGDTVIIKETSGVKAYRWSQHQFQWKLIGDVVENEEKVVGKQMYNGIEYDYIFSVDIEEGSPLLKLPYNKDEDPYIVAEKFIKDNNLNPRYVKRIANFITINLQIAPILKDEAQCSNPFASGSRYVSNSSLQNAAGPSTSSISPPHNSLVLNSYIPQKYYLKLEQGNVFSIYEKLKEFNEKNEDGIESISNNKLASLIDLINNGKCESVGDEMSTIITLLNWPDTVVFPVLDIARLAVLHKNVNREFCTNCILNILKRHLEKEAIVTNQMLSFRVLSNLFVHEAGEQFCLGHRNEILNMISNLTEFGNKNNEVAVSTYILNLAVALNKTNDTLGKLQILSVMFKLLESVKETEAAFRILVGLGSLILDASDANERNEFIKIIKKSRPVLKALRILLNGVDSSDVPLKLLSVTREILKLIKR